MESLSSLLSDTDSMISYIKLQVRSLSDKKQLNDEVEINKVTHVIEKHL